MKVWRVPYPKFGDGPGLERVAAIAAKLGVDLAAFGAAGVGVVGSNGKGSTAALSAALLQQRNAPVGLFTSPHLFALNERFRIDGEDISDAELQHHWERVADAARAAGVEARMGGFEFLFLIAADWFAARGCTHTVWEAGLGGRLDPVRLIEARRLALTALDLEHTALLGATLEEITAEKIAAAPAGACLFVHETCAVPKAVESHAGACGVKVSWVRDASLGALVPPLHGAHQRANTALALAMARDLTQLDDEAAARGLASTHWPGRMEMLNEEPLIVIDVGHTPDGIRAAGEAFAALRGARHAVLVCGVSRDKDAGVILNALAPGFDVIICTAAAHQGETPARIAAHAQSANPKAEIILAESVQEARKLALAKAAGGAVYVAGGLFLAAEFRAVHLGRDPAALAFF